MYYTRGMTDKELEELNNYKELVASLAVAQKKTDEQLKETDEQIKSLRDSQADMQLPHVVKRFFAVVERFPHAVGLFP